MGDRTRKKEKIRGSFDPRSTEILTWAVLKTNDRQEARRRERSADSRQVPDSGLQQAEVPCHTAKQRDLGPERWLS